MTDAAYRKLRELDEDYRAKARTLGEVAAQAFFQTSENGTQFITLKGRCLVATHLAITSDLGIGNLKTPMVRHMRDRYMKDRSQRSYLYQQTGTALNRIKTLEETAISKLDAANSMVVRHLIGLSDPGRDFCERHGEQFLKDIATCIGEAGDFSPQDIERFKIKMLADKHTNLTSFYNKIREAFDSFSLKATRRSQIDTRLVQITSSVESDKTLELVRSLKNADGPKIICVCGSPNSGRATLVRTALKKLDIDFNNPAKQYYRCEENISELMDATPSMPLPILGIDCREKSYLDILAQTAQFFGIEDHLSNGSNTIKQLLEEIQIAARLQPALFIFASPDISRRGLLARTKDLGLRRLLLTLAQANFRSRIIVTNVEPWKTGYETRSGIEVLDLDVDDPVLDKLQEFFVNSPVLHENVIDALATHEHLLNKVLPGSLLSLAVSAIRLSDKHPSSDITIQRVVGCLVKLVSSEDYADEIGLRRTTTPKIMSASVLSAYADLWDMMQATLLERLPVFDWLLPLIAASDDGLTASTLQYLFRNFDVSGTEKPLREVLVALGELSDTSKGRLVFKYRVIRPNVVELNPTELSRDTLLNDFSFEGQAPRHMIRYVMDGPIAQGLIFAVKRAESEVDKDGRYRRTYRTISRLARLRAKWVKLQSPHVYGENKRDLNRDILALVSLLASLDPEKILATARNEVEGTERRISTAFKEGRVFSGDPKETLSDLERLAFAYHIMFRRDIDRDNRLTMRLDQDALRLDILLQFFHGVGKRQYSSLNDDQQQLPDQIPNFLLHTFSPATIADLLTSIGVSSLYADRPGILRRAIKLAESYRFSLLPEEFRDGSKFLDMSLSIDMTFLRLWEAEVDALFLGYVPKGSTPNEAWDLIDERLKEIERRLKIPLSEGTDNHDKHHEHRKRARVRILVQRLRLDTFRATLPKKSILTKVHDIMTEASSIFPLERSSNAGLSGRNARRMIRALLGEPALNAIVGHDPTLDERVRLAEDLLRLNIARLSQYSGGDRVGVLIDQSLLSIVRGDLVAALGFVEQAGDSLLHESLSLGLQADLLWVHAQVLYAVGRTSEETSKDLIDDKRLRLIYLQEAHDYASRLSEISSGRFPYYFGVAVELLRRIEDVLISERVKISVVDKMTKARARKVLSRLRSPASAEVGILEQSPE